MSDTRKCTECWHWWFDGGEPDYSEVTLGYEGETGCHRGRWKGLNTWGQARMIKFHELDMHSFRKYLAKAEACPDFADRALPEPQREAPASIPALSDKAP